MPGPASPCPLGKNSKSKDATLIHRDPNPSLRFLRSPEYKLKAAAASSEVAAALCVKQGSPIFRIERTSYSTGSIPVGYEKLYYRGDLVRFVTRLARKR